MTLIIGLTGYAQHGKDTVGQEAVEHFGFQRFAFADPLKSMALTLNPIVRAVQSYDTREGERVDEDRLAEVVSAVGWEAAKQLPEVRRFLQVLGTEAVRDHLGEDSWVEATSKAIWDADIDRAVITDARFPNEFAFIKRRGVLIKVTRLNDDGSVFDNGVGQRHPSEQHIATAPADFTIEAKTGVGELRGLAHDLIAGVVLDRG